MTYVVVAPYAYRPFHDEMMAGCRIPTDRMLTIDNTTMNVGLVRSWNLGVDAVYASGADWLVHLSSAIRFGPAGGLDFVDLLDAHPDHYVIHATAAGNDPGDLAAGGASGVFGWHLTAFHRTVFDSIGRFDENFQPYGADDIDLSIRIQHHYQGAPGWDSFPVDVTDTEMAHGIKRVRIKRNLMSQRRYFERKWGRPIDDPTTPAFDHPFDDPTLPLSFWPTPPDRRAVRHPYWSGPKRIVP